LTAINIEDNTSTILAPVPEPPTNNFCFEDIHVVNGRVFALLPDMRIPVWDPRTGSLVQIFTIPSIPNANRFICPTDFSSRSTDLQFFVQTNKRNQMSSKSPLEFTAYQPDPNLGLVIKASSSFDFNSRAPLRRILPEEILSSEFILGHFVVVYLKETPTNMTFYAAVMKKNSNNDLGELKTVKLETCNARINKNLLTCKITPTHIVFSYREEAFIIDFTP
jgi:hypothetical protein